MSALPPQLRLDDCQLNVWVHDNDNQAAQVLLEPLNRAGVQFKYREGPAALPGRYFGDYVDEGHVLCWSSAWLPREKVLLSLLQSAFAHQFMLLDLDATAPQRVRAQGLSVDVNTHNAARVQLQVMRFALQRLEWGWGRSDNTPTEFLPATLKLTFSGRGLQVPADFDGLIAVGRSSSCQVQLVSDYVSRLHGCFQVTAEGFSYRDMSRNGTVLVQGHEEIVLHESETLLTGAGSLRVGDQQVGFVVAAS